MAHAVKKANPRKTDVAKMLLAAGDLARFPAKRFWVDYDEQADVLYVSFRRPQKATDSEVRDDGVIIRTVGKVLVGLTVLDASRR